MASIPYSTLLDAQPLPIDAQDINTNPVLVIAGTLAGTPPSRKYASYITKDPPTTTAMSYAALPVTFADPDAMHATYVSSRAMAVAAGTNPWLEPANLDPALVPGTSNFTNAGSPSAVRDGDPVTYATPTDPTALASIRFMNPVQSPLAAPGLYYGVRLTYSFLKGSTPGYHELTGAPASASLLQIGLVRDDGLGWWVEHYVSAQWDLEFTAVDEVREIYAVIPFDARTHPDNAARIIPPPSAVLPIASRFSSQLSVTVEPQSSDSDFKLFSFYPLLLNASLLSSMVGANVRVPASDPKRIIAPGIVPLEREHTVTGWPGGDYTGVVAQQQFDVDRTVIDFEQAGAPTGMPAESLEAARQRNASTQRAIDTSTYNLLMGERQ